MSQIAFKIRLLRAKEVKNVNGKLILPSLFVGGLELRVRSARRRPNQPGEAVPAGRSGLDRGRGHRLGRVEHRVGYGGREGVVCGVRRVHGARGLPQSLSRLTCKCEMRNAFSFPVSEICFSLAEHKETKKKWNFTQGNVNALDGEGCQTPFGVESHPIHFN